MNSLSKIVVIGTCGAGKSHFSDALSKLLSIPHFELDEYYWSANWSRVPEDIFRQKVSELATGESWVMDGNYGVVRDVIWDRAETIIWLDYSFSLVMGRLIFRTIVRILGRVRIWHGNKETWARLLGKDSIVWWGVSTYSRRRREYARLWKSRELQDFKLVRFSSPRQASEWLGQLQLRC